MKSTFKVQQPTLRRKYAGNQAADDQFHFSGPYQLSYGSVCGLDLRKSTAMLIRGCRPQYIQYIYQY